MSRVATDGVVIVETAESPESDRGVVIDSEDGARDGAAFGAADIALDDDALFVVRTLRTERPAARAAAPPFEAAVESNGVTVFDASAFRPPRAESKVAGGAFSLTPGGDVGDVTPAPRPVPFAWPGVRERAEPADNGDRRSARERRAERGSHALSNATTTRVGLGLLRWSGLAGARRPRARAGDRVSRAVMESTLVFQLSGPRFARERAGDLERSVMGRRRTRLAMNAPVVSLQGAKDGGDGAHEGVDDTRRKKGEKSVRPPSRAPPPAPRGPGRHGCPLRGHRTRPHSQRQGAGTLASRGRRTWVAASSGGEDCSQLSRSFRGRRRNAGPASRRRRKDDAGAAEEGGSAGAGGRGCTGSTGGQGREAAARSSTTERLRATVQWTEALRSPRLRNEDEE